MRDIHDNIQRFAELEDIYSRFAGNSGGNISDEEMEGLYVLVTQCSSPDKFFKFVEYKQKIRERAMDRNANNTLNGWRMLPPEQRIL